MDIKRGQFLNGVRNGLYVFTDVEVYEYNYTLGASKGINLALADARDRPILRQDGSLVKVYVLLFIFCDTGMYIAPGTENLLSLEIFATNVTEDAVSFFKAGKQRNCYLDTDFQPPIFSKVSLIFFYMFCRCIF